MDDLRLLHHWTTKASPRHSLNLSSNSDLWGADIVEVAFEHPFLLHGLLALAAVHKTTETSQADHSNLLAQADAHMSQCLGPYKRSLETITLETSLPSFLLSCVLVTYTLASARVREPEDPIDALLHCFRLLRGVKFAVGAHFEHLLKQPIVADILSGIQSESDPSHNEGEVPQIKHLTQLLDRLDASNAETCVQTIDSLHQIFVLIHNCEDEEKKHSICMLW